MPSISQSTLTYLSELKNNNNRDWFLKNKSKYLLAIDQIKSLSNYLTIKIEEHDSLEKSRVLRIYRDVRFSKNKSPYKTHFGIGFSRSKPSLRGSYYLHIEPKQSFLGCGFWDPQPQDLLRIRKELEYSGDEFRTIIQKKAFKQLWGTLKGNEVKTKPKGFDINHPNIDLIRKKQFLFSIPFSNKQVLDSGFPDKINEAIIEIRPFLDFMSHTLTTNLNGESIL